MQENDDFWKKNLFLNYLIFILESNFLKNGSKLEQKWVYLQDFWIKKSMSKKHKNQKIHTIDKIKTV